MNLRDDSQERYRCRSEKDSEYDDESGMLFMPYDPQAEVERTRRNLPHWQQAGVAYFITFRLADSLPATKLYQWMEERKAWFKRNPEPWNSLQWLEFNRHFPARMENWLDAGEGECILSNNAVSQIVEGALHHFDGQRYVLDMITVMPNHVHVLVSPMPGFDLSHVLHSWKSYSAHEINKLLGRSGTVWQDENFDHIVRSVDQFELYQQYIRENPAKGRVAPGKFRLGTGIGLILDEGATE